MNYFNLLVLHFYYTNQIFRGVFKHPKHPPVYVPEVCSTLIFLFTSSKNEYITREKLARSRSRYHGGHSTIFITRYFFYLLSHRSALVKLKKKSPVHDPGIKYTGIIPVRQAISRQILL